MAYIVNLTFPESLVCCYFRAPQDLVGVSTFLRHYLFFGHARQAPHGARPLVAPIRPAAVKRARDHRRCKANCSVPLALGARRIGVQRAQSVQRAQTEERWFWFAFLDGNSSFDFDFNAGCPKNSPSLLSREVRGVNIPDLIRPECRSLGILCQVVLKRLPNAFS